MQREGVSTSIDYIGSRNPILCLMIVHHSPCNSMTIVYFQSFKWLDMIGIRIEMLQLKVNPDTCFPLFDTGTPWYVMWYMWFLYALILWALLIPLFIVLFFYRKKRATKELPPPDPWIGN